jgi:hypothetical protein
MRATLLLVVLLLGCDLLPTNPAAGRCSKDGDCPNGFTCATDRNDPATFYRCVCSGDACADGGAPPTDARAADAPGSCGRNEDCPMARPVCAAGACVECAENAQCKDPSKGFCASNACVGCAAAGAGACTGAKPVCGAAGSCVECAENAQCRDVTRPFCMAGVCMGCALAGGTACALRFPGGPNVCGPTGACVECTDAAAHCKAPGKGFCVANACVGCQAAGAGACKAPTAVCDPPSGKCVECVVDTSCAATPNRPFCLANACAGCEKAAPTACAMKDPAAPVCAADGRCVECNASSDCTADASRPICLGNKCVRCSSDGECAAKLGANPGVCMAHQDGRCARDEDAIYVQNTAGCGTTGGLSAAAPLCAPRDAVGALATRRLIVVRGAVGGFALTLGAVPQQVSIVGQSDAVFAGGPDPGFRLSGATDVYMRGVTVRNSEGIGVIAEAGATLRLERVTVSGNQKGGILLDGVAFDVKNTSVTGNGPGQLGLASWGGILVNAPGGTARLERVSIKDNRATGLTCSGAIQGVGVLASGNAAVDIATTCAITPCTPAGPACGAQF